jgi:hypothetical protein
LKNTKFELIFVEYAIVLINAVLELSSKIGSERPFNVILVSNDIVGSLSLIGVDIKVGCIEGINVCIKVGLKVDTEVGTKVGLKVGCIDGIKVGCIVDKE